jgi:hypothetical protein
MLEQNPMSHEQIKRLTGKRRTVRFYRSKGWHIRDTHPYRVKRYECFRCKTSFCYTSFKLSYGQRRSGINSKIFKLFTIGASNREISRQLSCSEHLIRGRLKRMFQWSLLRQTELLKNVRINEPITFDGLESFAGSQYDPNNIQQAIGKESLFIYDFNFCPLNRKGRMSAWQKIIRSEQDKTIGRYPPRAIRTSTKEIFMRLYERRQDQNSPLVLFTDEHFQYRRVVQKDLRGYKILHKTVSSKECRNYQNLIFPVNHADLMIRQHVAAFKRETISFSKTHERMIQKFTLFMVWKNFFRPQFVKPQKNNQKANIQTPAMALGICKKKFEFHEFFHLKRTIKQVPLNREWDHFFHEKPTYSRVLQKAA